MRLSRATTWILLTLLLSFPCIAFLAGCGSRGGSGTAQVPQATSPLDPTQTLTRQSLTEHAAGNVTFAVELTLLRSQVAGNVRQPEYISPSTESLTVLTDGANPVIVNLVSSSPNCSPNPNAPGSYICTASLSVASGNHTFTLSAYDQTNGTGKLLSTNKTGTIYVKPTGITTVSVVLKGVVQYVALALNTSMPPVGTVANENWLSLFGSRIFAYEYMWDTLDDNLRALLNP